MAQMVQKIIFLLSFLEKIIDCLKITNSVLWGRNMYGRSVHDDSAEMSP